MEFTFVTLFPLQAISFVNTTKVNNNNQPKIIIIIILIIIIIIIILLIILFSLKIKINLIKNK